MSKQNKFIATENRLVIIRGEGSRRVGEMGKGVQLYGVGW